MSADVRIIIGHNLTAKEIIRFPEKLDQAQELKDCFFKNIQSKLDHKYSREDVVDKLQKGSSWGDISEFQIAEFWKNNSNSELVSENGYISQPLHTWFGWVYFNERTVDMYYFPEHKYANLQFASHRKFILEFSRLFATLLGQSQIVYYNDQSITSTLGDEATEGRPIDKIIEHAILNYGKPTDSLKEAINNHFILDNTDNPLQDIEGDLV